MQMGQLLDGDAAGRSVAAVAGGLRHLIEFYEQTNLSSNEMCIADASNYRQAKQRNQK